MQSRNNAWDYVQAHLVTARRASSVRGGYAVQQTSKSIQDAANAATNLVQINQAREVELGLPAAAFCLEESSLYYAEIFSNKENIVYSNRID